MSATVDWSDDEQYRLEQALVQHAAIASVKEKWKAVAQDVGTRNARACAERFKTCRALALAVATEAASESMDWVLLDEGCELNIWALLEGMALKNCTQQHTADESARKKAAADEAAKDERNAAEEAAKKKAEFEAHRQKAKMEELLRQKAREEEVAQKVAKETRQKADKEADQAAEEAKRRNGKANPEETHEGEYDEEEKSGVGDTKIKNQADARLSDAERRAADMRKQVEANKERLRRREEEEERRRAKAAAALQQEEEEERRRAKTAAEKQQEREASCAAAQAKRAAVGKGSGGKSKDCRTKGIQGESGALSSGSAKQPAAPEMMPGMGKGSVGKSGRPACEGEHGGKGASDRSALGDQALASSWAAKAKSKAAPKAGAAAPLPFILDEMPALQASAPKQSASKALPSPWGKGGGLAGKRPGPAQPASGAAAPPDSTPASANAPVRDAWEDREVPDAWDD